jgi:hypothetical protein
MSDRLPDFIEAIVEPVVQFNVRYSAGLLAGWTYSGYFWSNLCGPLPAAHVEITEAMTAGKL